MLGLVPVECHGAPRDLGLDQGAALAEQVRRAARTAGTPGLLTRALGLGRNDPRALAVSRDLLRFFPHHAERTAGLARGARVSERALAALLLRELAEGDARHLRAGAGVAVAVGPERTRGGAIVARALDLPMDGDARFVARRSAPEGDYRSVEIALPWLVAPVAGLNEHGLAAVATTIPPGRRALATCAAPALFLVQDVLQRFDTTQKALEWCQRRPAGGSASILLADAAGDVACVILEGRRRSVRRRADGLLLGLGRQLRCDAVAKSCHEQGRLDAEALLRVFASHEGTAGGDDDSPCRHGEKQATAGLVILEPAERRMLLLDGPPCQGDAGRLRVLRP